jgi:hypothetical protein
MAESGNPQGHETRDLSLRSIVLAAGGLLLFLVIVSFVLSLLYAAFARTAQSNEIPSMVTPQLPPEPRLEVAPGGNLQALEATEDKQLSTYGWIDRKRGVVHIPIDQAMQLLAKRGLPTSSPTPQWLEF